MKHLGQAWELKRSRALLSRRARLWLLAGISLAAIISVYALPPIPQDPAYHRFIDQRALFGIPNFLDVISNAPFLLVGIAGLFFLWQQSNSGSAFIERVERWPYVLLFLGVLLTCFGSAYYHLAPDNERLVWDRLPMTLSFMSFFAAIIVERISIKAGLQLLLPLILLGAGSVIYWHWSEVRGMGDLRPYVAVQFFPLLATPLIALLFPPRYSRGGDLVVVIGLYVLAKILEGFDEEIFALGRIVSGHTLKHLAAGIAAYWLLRMLRLRQPAYGR